MNGQEPVVLNSEQALRLRALLWRLRDFAHKGRAASLGDVVNVLNLVGMGDARRPVFEIPPLDAKEWLEDLSEIACCCASKYMLDDLNNATRLIGQGRLTSLENGELECLIGGLLGHFEDQQSSHVVALRKIMDRFSELDS